MRQWPKEIMAANLDIIEAAVTFWDLRNSQFLVWAEPQPCPFHDCTCVGR